MHSQLTISQECLENMGFWCGHAGGNESTVPRHDSLFCFFWKLGSCSFAVFFFFFFQGNRKRGRKGKKKGGGVLFSYFHSQLLLFLFHIFLFFFFRGGVFLGLSVQRGDVMSQVRGEWGRGWVGIWGVLCL